MKTVFDYNITPEEWRNISRMDKETYLSVVDEESANYDLALLFYERGEKEKARAFADKLPPNTKNDFWRSVTHP